MLGKLIVIEGNDCSGKDTQTKLLVSALREKGSQAEMFAFPNYDSPTGKIINGPYLGNATVSNSWFKEGPVQVNPKVAALYYAADRKYNIHKITWLLEHGIHVILDRYVYSNMAHQGAKIEDKMERAKMFQWLETLEFDLLELPRPDIAIFLHMPLNEVKKLKQNRKVLDENEQDDQYLSQAEQTYLELTKRYHFHTIECANPTLRTIEEIHTELFTYVESQLKENA